MLLGRVWGIRSKMPPALCFLPPLSFPPTQRRTSTSDRDNTSKRGHTQQEIRRHKVLLVLSCLVLSFLAISYHVFSLPILSFPPPLSCPPPPLCFPPPLSFILPTQRRTSDRDNTSKRGHTQQEIRRHKVLLVLSCLVLSFFAISYHVFSLPSLFFQTHKKSTQQQDDTRYCLSILVLSLLVL